MSRPNGPPVERHEVKSVVLATRRVGGRWERYRAARLGLQGRVKTVTPLTRSRTER